MINYGLPTSVTVNGTEYAIRSDFRAVLDIFTALNDPELDGREKAAVALEIFYEDAEDIPEDDYAEALAEFTRFVNGGREDAGNNGPKVIDWEYDFQYIVAPINRVVGRDVRGDAYMHWWTFLAAFKEIGDCTLAQIVRIRTLKAKGKLTDKSDKEWYRQNRDLVDIPTKYTDAENDLLKKWGGVNG